MNFVKRAFLSVKERKIKSLVLIVIFLIISNLILAGFSIQTATKKASDLAIQKLGSDVTLSVDQQKLRENGVSRSEMPALTVSEANKLKSLKYVTGYNYFSSSVAMANGFTPITSEENEESNNNVRVFGVGPGGQQMNADVSLSGVVYTDLLDSFNDGTEKIVSGRALNEEDVNKSVAIIEKQLADSNELKVGSTLQIKSADEEKNITLTIVGIYENSTEETDIGIPADFLNPANKMYVPYTVANQLKNNSAEGTIDRAVYYLDSPTHMEAFKAEAEKTSVDFEKYKIDANEMLYKQMMGPIENVASFSKLVVIIVAIAGAIILGLIVFLSIKERRQEMGILLSIGERKGKLMGQFVVEMLMIVILALGLSVFTGNTISQKIGDTLLQNEISTTQEKQQNSPRMIRMGMGFNGQQTKVEAIDEIDVSVTIQDVGKMGAMGVGIVLLSTLIPTLSVLRLRPKTILTKNE